MLPKVVCPFKSDRVFLPKFQNKKLDYFVKLEKLKFEIDIKLKELILFNDIFIMVSFPSQNL